MSGAERLRTWNSSAANLETRVRNGVFFDSELGLDAEDALNELVTENKRLGNELAQERSKPGGSFDQWDRLQKLELENERLVAALEFLLDIAERMRAEAHVAPETWYLARDSARAALTPQADAAGPFCECTDGGHADETNPGHCLCQGKMIRADVAKKGTT